MLAIFGVLTTERVWGIFTTLTSIYSTLSESHTWHCSTLNCHFKRYPLHHLTTLLCGIHISRIWTLTLFLFWHFDLAARLTTFPDYRIPQVLHSIGVLKCVCISNSYEACMQCSEVACAIALPPRYSSQLEEKILAKTPLIAGSEEEVEIRAATVQVFFYFKCPLPDRLANTHTHSLSLPLSVG